MSAMPSCKITIVGTSFVRRLRDDITHRGNDLEFEHGFGLSQAHISYGCGGGWTLQSVRDHVPEIVSSKPDYVILKAGSNDLASVSLLNSIKVADDLLELSKFICSESGAKGIIVCQITKRKAGKYMRSRADVDAFNRKVDLANNFLCQVIDSDTPHVTFWRQFRGSSPYVEHLLLADGTHYNHAGQRKFYKSLRGAIIFAAKKCGIPLP